MTQMMIQVTATMKTQKNHQVRNHSRLFILAKMRRVSWMVVILKRQGKEKLN